MTTTTSATARRSIGDGTWRLDPERSSVDFHVRHFYGLMTVIGCFTRYEGVLDLGADPAIDLTIDADSLDTGVRKRDQHLRSAEFFDVVNHPQVRFVSDAVTLERDTLTVDGRLYAAGREIPLHVNATVREIEGALEVGARALANHRELGMTWSPLGIMRAPSELIVRGRLIPTEDPR